MRFFTLPILFITTYSFGQVPTNSDSLRTIETESISIVGLQHKYLSGSGYRVTNTQLQKMNQTDVNKVLRSMPGIQVRDEEGFGLRPNIGLRGTPVNRSAKITIMEDGILMAPAAYADPSAYYFPTFGRMSGVEVLKGSSQIKYGPYTIGGAINLLSTCIPTTFKAYAQASFGSFGINQQHFWVGDTKGQFSYLFELNRLATRGFKELDGGGNTGFDRRDYLGKLRWQSKTSAKVQQSLQLKLLHTEEVANETYLGLNFADFQQNPLRRYAGTQKDLLSLYHKHLILQHVISPFKNLQITTSGYITTTFRDWGRANSFGGQSINAILADNNTNQIGYQIMTGQTNGEVIFRSAARTYLTKGLQSNLRYQFKTGAIRHSAELGLRFHQDEANRYGTQSKYQMTSGKLILTDGGEQGNQENQIRQAQSFASYFNYQLQYRKWTLHAGLRQEHIQLAFFNYGTADFSRTGSNLTSATNRINVWLPGTSLFFELNEKNNLFAGVHKGFSPPGMPSTTSNTQALAETALNYELGYRLLSQKVQIQAVLFRSDYQNLLGSDNISGGGLGSGDLFNAGKALVQGVELSAQYLMKLDKIKDLQLPIRCNYTYTQATFAETFINGGGDWGSGQINSGDLIPFITPHLFNGSLGIERQKWNAQLSANYVGRTRTIPGKDAYIVPTSNENYAQVNSIKGFAILDFSCNYELSSKWVVYGTVQNVTNNLQIVANLPQGYRSALPRTFMLGFKLKR
ncbi:MAG: TonB-dependent receptor family protein [Flavobacteriales bacterium]